MPSSNLSFSTLANSHWLQRLSSSSSILRHCLYLLSAIHSFLHLASCVLAFWSICSQSCEVSSVTKGKTQPTTQNQDSSPVCSFFLSLLSNGHLKHVSSQALNRESLATVTFSKHECTQSSQKHGIHMWALMAPLTSCLTFLILAHSFFLDGLAILARRCKPQPLHDNL